MTGRKKYELSEPQKLEFGALFLLHLMAGKKKAFPVMLDGDDSHLESTIDWLHERNYIEILNDREYAPTYRGLDALKRFLRRYIEFLKVFDVYCCVDLEKGEFAFSHYFEYAKDPEVWKSFLNQERWDDLRVAVAQYKGLDPVEIVFMNFLNENRFDHSRAGWQFDLLLGSVWDDLLEVLNTAIQVEELGYEDEQGKVPGTAVIKDVISQGAEVNLRVKKQEAERYGNLEDPKVQDLDSATGATVSPDTYEAYRDPDYVSPDWKKKWFK